LRGEQPSPRRDRRDDRVGKQRKERLVVTLATIPSRIASIRPVIDSIKNQTRKPDLIYVCVCEFCEWEQSSYEVPEWLGADDEVEVVVSPTDHGPANKLLGMLRAESSPATRIVIIDDDWAYRPDILEVLEKRFEHDRRAAIGSSGARIPREWSVMETRIGSEIFANPTCGISSCSSPSRRRTSPLTSSSSASDPSFSESGSTTTSTS
jgi:hypothetical protein